MHGCTDIVCELHARVEAMPNGHGCADARAALRAFISEFESDFQSVHEAPTLTCIANDRSCELGPEARAPLLSPAAPPLCPAQPPQPPPTPPRPRDKDDIIVLPGFAAPGSSLAAAAAALDRAAATEARTLEARTSGRPKPQSSLRELPLALESGGHRASGSMGSDEEVKRPAAPTRSTGVKVLADRTATHTNSDTAGRSTPPPKKFNSVQMAGKGGRDPRKQASHRGAAQRPQQSTIRQFFSASSVQAGATDRRC